MTGVLDFRSYISFKKKEDFSDWSGWKEAAGKPRLGAGYFWSQENFSASFKAGQNSYSKSVSKMKNPSPSSAINPLAKSFSFSTGAGSSLPSLSGSNQPVSYSISLNSRKNQPLQFGFEGFYNEENDGFCSVSAKSVFSRSVFAQAAFSAGRFYIENNSSILKKNNIAFEPGFFYSGLAEFCFHSPLLKLNLYSGLQESPYDVNPFWFKIDGRTSFGALMLNFSYFAIPTTKDSPRAAPLIGASSSICRTVEQASVNPQILILFDDKASSSIRIGVSALESWKVTSTNTPVQLNTAKIRAALGYENRFFNLHFDWTLANLLLDGLPPLKSAWPEEYQTFGLSSSFTGTFVKLSVSGSYSDYFLTPGNDLHKKSLSADLRLSIPKQHLSAQTGFDTSFKDCERTAGKIHAGAGYAVQGKYFRTSFKVEVKVPF